MMRALIIEPPMTEAQAAEWVTPEELAAARRFGTERRRREYLTWRAMVRRELGRREIGESDCEPGRKLERGVRIGYNEIGAPVIAGSEIHIGVSHCPGWVAVCLSDQPCAVDIEPESRNFSRTAERYLSPQERALSDDSCWPGIVWCAKETLYKYAGKTEVDWLHDLRVESVDMKDMTLVGRVGEGVSVRMAFCRREGFITVYIL